MGNIDKVGSALKRSLTIWVAAISLLGFAPAVIYAQRAKPPAAGKAPAPWKFHLQETRIEDIHRAIKSRQITCEKVVQAYLNRIRSYDGMCVAPVNPNDASDPRNLFPDVAKYTGTPLQPGEMRGDDFRSGKAPNLRLYSRREERGAVALAEHGQHPWRTLRNL